jgi:hypothetical protein
MKSLSVITSPVRHVGAAQQQHSCESASEWCVCVLVCTSMAGMLLRGLHHLGRRALSTASKSKAGAPVACAIPSPNR